MSKGNSVEMSEIEEKLSKEFKWKAATFLVSVTGISAIIGFGTTFAAAKRLDPEFFNKGMMPTVKVPETGAQLALRALGWGTLYAFTGCGVLVYSIWKLSGASNMEEFRMKMGSLFPKVPKNNPPVGRTEFSGLNDLLNYLQHLKGDKD
ncbi:hypothetical protein HHI36_005664 [Cryptolaemus montrouzieri]|uniref:Transmembrane protein 242 n=1 Tax=Cryptolaemus montrouzieri TaxID=559131 RepID=A0ABD2NUT2_9CUCU